MSAEIRGSSPALPVNSDLNNHSQESKKSSPPRAASAPRDAIAQRLNDELMQRFQKKDEETKPLSKIPDSKSVESTTPRSRSFSNLMGTLKQNVVKLVSDEDKKADPMPVAAIGKESPRSSKDRSSSPRTEARVSVNYGKDIQHLNKAIQEIADTESTFLEGLQEAVNRMNLIFRLQKGENLTESMKLDPFYRAIIKYQTLLDTTSALRALFAKSLEAENFIEKQKLIANAYLSGTYKLYTLLLTDCSNLSVFLNEHAKSIEADQKISVEIRAFRKQNPKFEKLDEMSLYITSLQRIVRHELLIKSVRQAFSPSSPYYKDLTMALEKAEKTARTANYDQRRISDNIPAFLKNMAEEINKATDFGPKHYQAELLILAMSDLAFDLQDYTFIFRTLDDKVKDPLVKLEAFQLLFETISSLNKLLYERIVKAVNKQPHKPSAFLEVVLSHIDMLKKQLNPDDNIRLQSIKESYEKLRN